MTFEGGQILACPPPSAETMGGGNVLSPPIFPDPGGGMHFSPPSAVWGDNDIYEVRDRLEKVQENQVNRKGTSDNNY